VSVSEGSSHTPTTVLLATARVLVCTDSGRHIQLRALIDTGSEATFITERAVQLLKARRQKVNIQVTGLGGQSNGVVHFSTKLTLKPCSSQGDSVPVTALILPNLTSYSPITTFNKSEFSQLTNMHLADSNPSSRDRIDLLIGADIYGSILLNGVRKVSNNTLVAQHTIFGSILFGFCANVNSESLNITANLQCTITPSLDTLLKGFWEVEELSLPPSLSKEDQMYEEHFLSTHSRLSNGRYAVRLPFKSNFINNLGDSLHIASKSLDRLKGRLSRDSKLAEAYKEFLQEYLTLGHMAPLAPQEITSSRSYYFPHHPVLKESSTSPVRVVFNASCSTSTGLSLNDCLLTGPKLQGDLPAIILR
jgi:hypothetical protein